MADAPVQQIRVGGHAVVAAEGAHEVGGVSPATALQLRQGEGAGTLVLHQLGGSLQVPGRAVIPLGRGEPGQQLAAEEVAGHFASQGSGSSTSCR